MLTSFPAKILLLGEYTILSGSKALALPFHPLIGRWSFQKTQTHACEISRRSLWAFLDKSAAQSVNLEQMKVDFQNGLWFDSTIPQGFGLGSSGAVIAAIYARYGIPTGDIQKDKKALAGLEDFFHGSSSGLDPLVSHIQRPLLIHSFSEVEVLGEMPNLEGFFLLNTGKPRQTGPLVSIYQEKIKDPQFKQGCSNILVKEVNFAINAVMKGNSERLFHHLWHISKFQWDFFPEMIPTRERVLWTKGIETGDYVLKLCGAGGGGFILGYSNKYSIDEMKEILNSHELRGLI
jgi:mevalonate kinase